ncbi:MAG TPA: hypothetical protein ENH82_02545 [bacterium]|nr:hypothetical protein [bacterium]
MSAIQKVSFSKLTTWRTCHMQYNYRYVQKLRRKQKSAALYTGGSVHDALEAFYKGKSWNAVLKNGQKSFNKLFKEERDRLGDIPGITRNIVERYIDNWADADLTPIKTEAAFEVEIKNGIVLEGKIDLIASDSKDRVWVEEHKTCKTMPDEAVRMADTQSIIYGSKIIMNSLGFARASGVIWDYLRKKIPVVPELLKKGGLSKNKGIDTTPEIYMQAIVDNKLDPNDYRDVLDKLEYKDEAFFKRVKLPLSKHMTDSVLNDVVSTGTQIRVYGELWTDKNMGKMRCNYCDYFQLCQAEVRGAPDDYIREHQYEISTGRPKNDKGKKESRTQKESRIKKEIKQKNQDKRKAKVKRRIKKDPARTRVAPGDKRTTVRKKRDR